MATAVTRPPDDLSDLEIMGAAVRLAEIEVERQAREHGRPLDPTATHPKQLGPPSPPLPDSARWCRCSIPPVADECWKCGRPAPPPTNGRHPHGHPSEPNPQCSKVDIAELKRLLTLGDGAAWRTGDAVLRLVPMSKRGANTGAKALLAKLAQLVGCEPRTLRPRATRLPLGGSGGGGRIRLGGGCPSSRPETAGRIP